MFVTPGMRSLASSRCMISSFIKPAGHWSLGLNVTIVSLMLIGAGSVEVSARPIFPTTFSTAGSWAMIRSCWRMISAAFVREMLGSVMGIHIAVSSSRGGMNSDPIVLARNNAKAKSIMAETSVTPRCLSAKRRLGA